MIPTLCSPAVHGGANMEIQRFKSLLKEAFDQANVVILFTQA